MDIYLTHGRKYHVSGTCPLMVGGEFLWDSDSEENWWVAGAFRRTVTSLSSAAAHGKLPCLGCVPAEHRVFPPLYGETFGHEQVLTGHIGFGGRPTAVCARCTERGVSIQIGGDDPAPLRIAWPCRSAVVLGLVPRPENDWGLMA